MDSAAVANNNFNSMCACVATIDDVIGPVWRVPPRRLIHVPSHRLSMHAVRAHQVVAQSRPRSNDVAHARGERARVAHPADIAKLANGHFSLARLREKTMTNCRREGLTKSPMPTPPKIAIAPARATSTIFTLFVSRRAHVCVRVPVRTCAGALNTCGQFTLLLVARQS